MNRWLLIIFVVPVPLEIVLIDSIIRLILKNQFLENQFLTKII